MQEVIGQDCYKCSGFNSCHDNLQDGSCSDFHWYCPVGGEEDSGRNGGVDRIELTAALRLGNAAKVSRLIAEHEDYEINVEREAIQVADCRGMLVAHVPLPAGFRDQLAISSN